MEVMATAIPTVVGAARLRFTTRADGDFHADLVAPEELRRRQRAVVDLPWTFLDEVHGVEVVTVREPGQHTGARGRRRRHRPRPARCSASGSATARPSPWWRRRRA